MSKIVDSSLKSAVKGTALVFFGMVASILIWFTTQWLIIRSATAEEFGLYTLAMTVGGVLSALAFLGMQEGATRYVSTFLGEGKREDADSIARSSMHLGIMSGMVTCALLYILSGVLARHVFYKPEIAAPLRAISFFVPLSVATGIISSILRGHGIIRPKVYFQDIGQPSFFLVLLAAALLLGLSYMGFIYAHILSMAIVLMLIAIYGHRKIGPNPFSARRGRHCRKLLRFSLPLLFAGLSYMVLSWTDTLMLGRYAAAKDVGIYNVSVSLAKLLTFALSALAFILLPLAGEMHAKGQSAELKRTYQVLTKWVFTATLPVFFILFFFPEMTIEFLFGERLVAAAVPLRILALGFLFHVFLGVNAILLTVFGKTRAIMQTSVAAAVLNIALNYVFIKRLGYGMAGAATATVVSYILLNAANSLILHRHSGIHPVTKRHIKPVVGSVAIGLIIYAIAKNLPLYLWMMPLYLVLFVGGYGLSILLTRSVDQEDVALFDAVSRKTGIEMRRMRKLILRFAQN
jgi:O-antigen/teichoic acid export membrane protein